jgi:hypothetical protein
MKNIIQKLIILCMISGAVKSQTIWDYLTEINLKIATIPYVFEGRITSVEIYAGDYNGNKLPNSAAVWNGDIGTFYQPNGDRAVGFSKAHIKLCKIYKGDLIPDQGVDVLTRSFSLNIYLLRTGSGSSADTSVQWIDSPTSDDPTNAYDFMKPKSSYSKKLYFCDRIDAINPAVYSQSEFYSNFHSILEAPFNHPITVMQPDGSVLTKNAYCALVPYGFDDQTQLQNFLNQIQTINPTPPDYCRDGSGKETVSVVQIGANPRQIIVYPNPSQADESVKIKFTLEKATDVHIVVTDITGKQIVNTSIAKQKNIVYDLNTKLEIGTYFLQLSFGNEKQSFKITKN